MAVITKSEGNRLINNSFVVLTEELKAGNYEKDVGLQNLTVKLDKIKRLMGKEEYADIIATLEDTEFQKYFNLVGTMLKSLNAAEYKYFENKEITSNLDLFSLLVNEITTEMGPVIHIDEGMRITFRLENTDEEEGPEDKNFLRYETDWDKKKDNETERNPFYSVVSLIKNIADTDSMDREMTFEELGEYKVSAKVYKVMKQNLFQNTKKLVQDYEFKVYVDESDDLYAQWDWGQKLLEALKNVDWVQVAGTTVNEVLKTLPQMVLMIITFSAVLIAVTMSPIGWLTPLIGLAMQAWGGLNTVKDVLAGLYLFTDAALQVKDAKSKRALEQASALFTKAFKYVGPNLLMDLLMMLGGKAVKKIKGGDDLKTKSLQEQKKTNKTKSVEGKKKLNNAKQATGKNINDIDSIEGYEKFKRSDGTTGLRRKKGMKGELDQLRVDEKGNIHNVTEETRKNKGIKNKHKGWTKLQKGNFGEIKMHEHYEKEGYTLISKNPTRDINAKGHKGIDGVYYKKDGHPPFIIGEAKYGSGKLSMTEDGLQMSDNWIFKSGRLEEAIGKNLADKLLMGEIEYEKQLFTYSKSGKITISIL